MTPLFLNYVDHFAKNPKKIIRKSQHFLACKMQQKSKLQKIGNEMNILMDSCRAIGENVSPKSMPSTCAYPFQTSLALFITTCPCSSSLFLYTQLLPIKFLSFCLGTYSQFLFFSILFDSSSMALIQHSSLLA